MIDNIDELVAKAVENKQEIKRKPINLIVGDSEEEFRISAIGEKAIKIERWFKWEEVMEATELGREDSLEVAIMKIIDEFEPSEGS